MVVVVELPRVADTTVAVPLTIPAVWLQLDNVSMGPNARREVNSLVHELLELWRDLGQAQHSLNGLFGMQCDALQASKKAMFRKQSQLDREPETFPPIEPPAIHCCTSRNMQQVQQSEIDVDWDVDKVPVSLELRRLEQVG